MAEAKGVADILVEVEFESDSSLGYVTMDSEDDRLHGYATHVLLGPNLFLHVSPYGGLVCPICPNRMPHGWNEANARAHVLVKARGLQDGYYTKDKDIARYRALARNQC